jgi:ABC-type sugar transport system ATPase subunit
LARIALDRLDKVYQGGVKALDDLNLEVGEGEFMVLVGPSGCGKSTVLRSIAGLEEITGGTISIGERVVNDLPPKDRDIAMDEPLSNLDAKLRVSMRAALNQLHERLGITTVYVTHDQVEAMTLGDRVCVIRMQAAGLRRTARPRQRRDRRCSRV